MPYPDRNTLAQALLLLLFAEGGSEARMQSRDTYSLLGNTFNLNEQERTQTRRFRDGRYEPEWNNKVQWSRELLRKRGYLAQSEHGIWQLSQKGFQAARAILRSKMAAQLPDEPVIPGLDMPWVERDSLTISLPDVEEINISVREGGKKLITHFRRERNLRIVNEKKRQALASQHRLKCEVCGFDFQYFYGDRGSDFCEVHHISPLSNTEREVETSLADLAIVCSNCHRMLHRQPFITIEKLRTEIRRQLWL